MRSSQKRGWVYIHVLLDLFRVLIRQFFPEERLLPCRLDVGLPFLEVLERSVLFVQVSEV